MEWLPKCLNSTGQHSVIVVDNKSSDGTVDFIKKNYPQIVLLEQERNLGFGQANNLGISYALREAAEYVFLLNQDAYLFENTLQELVQVHQENPQFGILSPIHLNGKGTRLDKNFSYYIDYNANPAIYSDFVLKNALAEVYEVPFVNAAGWLISRNCLETVGGFDPMFFHYGEDDNYCQRLKFYKFKVGVVPNQFVMHDRENRKKEYARPYRIENLNMIEKRYKLKFGDINNDFGIELVEIKKKLVGSVFKNLVLVRFRLVAYQLKELKMINRIIPEIKNSRERNKKRIATF